MIKESKTKTLNRVCFTPFHDANAYISLMMNAVKMTEYELYDGESRISAFMRCNIFHFNWDPFLALTGRFTIKRKIKYFLWLAYLKAIKIKGGRIIFTLHDKTWHAPDRIFSEHEKIRLFILKNAHKIVIHSHESISFIKTIVPDIDTRRIVYIPLPNYITAYHNIKHYTNYVKKNNELVLLFLGPGWPTKNVEIMIKTAHKLRDITNIRFLICGRVKSEYQERILQLAEGCNISTDLRFIEDDELCSLVELSDAMILPYNTESALNSSAAILAFSFGRTVIGTWTGTTRDIDESLVYCYEDTNDEEEHISRLKNAIMKFYEDFKRDKASVKAKGEKLRQIMITEHSLEKVAEGLSRAYE